MHEGKDVKTEGKGYGKDWCQAAEDWKAQASDATLKRRLKKKLK
jgi:hypothetical protein